MKPMLAGKFDPKFINFPVLASPKLDGVRGLIINGKLVSRTLKEIPNENTQAMFSGRPLLEGLDGELISGDPTAKDCYRTTNGNVMRRDGAPAVTFYVFDSFTKGGTFIQRLREIQQAGLQVPVKVLEHRLISNMEELTAYEAEVLEQGYEGLILRDPYGAYKHGRSTTREGGMIKVKRFEDSEAEIVGMQELMHNGNEAKKDNHGRTERSSHMENLVPLGTMGALEVRDIHTGQKFNIGTGFSDADRKHYWSIRHTLGQVVKYKHFPVGAKDLPRHPVYLGVRDRIDI